MIGLDTNVVVRYLAQDDARPLTAASSNIITIFRIGAAKKVIQSHHVHETKNLR